MRFILDLDDTLAHTSRDLQGDKTRLPYLKLLEGAREFIEKFGKDSILVSFARDFEYQKQKIAHLNLADAFKEIIIVNAPEGKEAAIRKAAADFGVPANEIILIGDRVDNEIRAGNRLGLITVRMKLPEGKYISINPEHPEEEPAYTVSSFDELVQLPIFS